jgi:hypothetical protein
MKFGRPALMPIHVGDGIKSCEIEKGCICVRTRVTNGCTGVMDGKFVGHLMRRQHRWGNIENQLVITPSVKTGS